MDEKGFMIRLCNIMKHIVVINQLKNKKLFGAGQNESQKNFFFNKYMC